MGKSLGELLYDMENAKQATIKEGQRKNAILKEIFSSAGMFCRLGSELDRRVVAVTHSLKWQ